ncbi:hypothetical protein BD311DRAFT_863124 [Dichomitus squalens]|uniref:Uncharacterized protein n=1 Tax=Dichomitus squalens TaxID=114155 RepID=A0A4Q9MZ88_9APHY|nr:hypothetical protein BD311DRAFT_863124 [Dichomitus squalens]
MVPGKIVDFDVYTVDKENDIIRTLKVGLEQDVDDSALYRLEHGKQLVLLVSSSSLRYPLPSFDTLRASTSTLSSFTELIKTMRRWRLRLGKLGYTSSAIAVDLRGPFMRGLEISQVDRYAHLDSRNSQRSPIRG